MKPLDEIQAAMAPLLSLDAGQRVVITAALVAWILPRASVPNSDPRLAALLKKIPALVEGITLSLDDEVGLAVRHAPSDAPLLLERGAPWLRGGDWRNVVVTCVSRKTPQKP